MKSRLHDPVVMADLLIDGLNRHSEQPCLYLGDTVLSYADVRDLASQMVQALKSYGLGKGSRVAILSANRPEVLTNLVATQLTGCVGTPLHPLGSLNDHAYVLNDVNAECLIFDPAVYEQRAGELKEHCPNVRHFLAFGESPAGDDYLAKAASFDPLPLENPKVDPDDITSISYTGGTTGKPKGVMHTYRSNAYMTMVQMAEWEFPEELRMLIATPLSHAAAAFFVPVLQKGGAFYVMQGFSPDEFFTLVERYKLTATMLVPAMIYILLDSERSQSADMSSMQTIFYGASAINPTRLAEAIARWGQIFFQFFGQSEAPMVLSCLKKHEHDPDNTERLGSCGRPSSWVQLALLDDDGNPVDPGEPGEICVRAPLVMKGYYNKPDATKDTIHGDWLHTGDVGRLDGDGYLHIVDRKKDMIVSGGFNVFPREVEDVIASHPAVAMNTVIGVPDDRWGEAVKAIVVLRPGIEATAGLEEEITSLVKTAKGSVQAPKSIDFRADIPLTGFGKPDKKALRSEYWKGEGRAVK